MAHILLGVTGSIAAFKAWDGKPYRYPLTIRLLG